MEPSLTADAATLISWCLSNNRPTDFFTARLGLPQKESNKKKKGGALFEGDLASSSTTLYRSILKIRRTLLVRFPTKQHLREVEARQRPSLIAELTASLLIEHGGAIWSSSPPFSTVIDGPNYPKHLKYNNSSDRERIELYLYCWIISKMSRSKPKNSNVGRRNNARTSRTFDLSDCDDDNDCVDEDDSDDGDECDDYDDAPGVDTESAETDDRGGRSSVRVSHDAAGTYSIPVAQMLPRRPNNSAAIDRPGRLQRATTRIVSDQVPTTGRSTKVPDNEGDDNDNLDLNLPPSPPSRSIKRRGGYSTRDQGQNKKQKGDGEESADNVDALSSRSDRAVRGETSVRRNGHYSYPSPPAMQPEPPKSAPDMRNFPNVTHKEQTMADADDAGDLVTEAPASTEEVQAEDVAEESRAEDGDSVQGTEEVESPNVISEPPRLVVPIRLTAQSKATENLRRRLGSNLLDVLPAGLMNPDLPLLSSIIEVVQALTKADHLRLRDIYDEDFNSFHGALDQWSECLKLLFQFCQLTAFNGNLASRSAFLDDMPIVRRFEGLRILNRGSSSLSLWRDDERMATKVGSMLSNLVWPQRWWTPNTMELLVQQLTEELIAWFD